MRCRSFDQTRQVIALKLGVEYEAASAFTTDDDFLGTAEDLEGDLSNADPERAGPLLAAFSEKLDAANKEYLEGSDARKAEQKAIAEREKVHGAVRPVFVGFRRCVRATHGSSSREYRELLDRTSRGGGEDPNEGQGGRSGRRRCSVVSVGEIGETGRQVPAASLSLVNVFPPKVETRPLQPEVELPASGSYPARYGSQLGAPRMLLMVARLLRSSSKVRDLSWRLFDIRFGI